MRTLLVCLLAGLLGVGAAVLVACGEDDDGGLIPPGQADRLKSNLEDVRGAVDNSDCAAAINAVNAAQNDVANFSRTVDSGLRRQLLDDLRELDERAQQECEEVETETEPEETETDTTETQTTETQQTETQQTETIEPQPVPPPEEPLPPPPEEPLPPPAEPPPDSGGTPAPPSP